MPQDWKTKEEVENAWGLKPRTLDYYIGIGLFQGERIDRNDRRKYYDLEKAKISFLKIKYSKVIGVNLKDIDRISKKEMRKHIERIKKEVEILEGDTFNATR